MANDSSERAGVVKRGSIAVYVLGAVQISPKKASRAPLTARGASCCTQWPARLISVEPRKSVQLAPGSEKRSTPGIITRTGSSWPAMKHDGFLPRLILDGSPVEIHVECTADAGLLHRGPDGGHALWPRCDLSAWLSAAQWGLRHRHPTDDRLELQAGAPLHARLARKA